VQILHGLAKHSARYARLAEALTGGADARTGELPTELDAWPERRVDAWGSVNARRGVSDLGRIRSDEPLRRSL
jgi:hypothetical protein